MKRVPFVLHRGAALAVLSLLLLAGCKTAVPGMSGYMRNKVLYETVLDYNKYLRWQDWDKASAFLKLDDQAAFKEKMEDAEDSFRLTDFEIKDTRPAPGGKTAAVRVFYRYYWLPSISERKMSVHQRWSWSDHERRWVIDNPFALPARSAKKAAPGASPAAKAGDDYDVPGATSTGADEDAAGAASAGLDHAAARGGAAQY